MGWRSERNTDKEERLAAGSFPSGLQDKINKCLAGENTLADYKTAVLLSTNTLFF